MSYEFKGKQIWGSAIYRIQCDLESRRIQQEFTGVLTLYERRHESKKVKFSNLDQFVGSLRDMWSASLRVDTVQDARLARWIEEYLPELGINVSYEEIMEILRGEYIEAPPIEVADEVVLSQEDIDKIVPQASDTTITGVTRTLKGAIDDDVAMERILDNFLQEYKPRRANSTVSTYEFQRDDKPHKMEHSFVFINSPIKDEIRLITEFSNPENSLITNLKITDNIPNDFQVVKISKPDNVTLEKEDDLHEGAVYHWNVDSLPPKGNLSMEYVLIQKMLRTILVRDDNDLNILQLQDDIRIDGSDIWIDSSYTFQDKTPVIENVKVMDQIPKSYKIIRSNPDITEPRAKIVETPQGSMVLWNFKNVPAATQMKIEYELEHTTRLFRDVITLLGKKETPVCEIVKIIKPIEKSSGYGVIYGVKTIDDLNFDLTISDLFPSQLELELKENETGNLEISLNGAHNVLKWNLNSLEKGREVYCYLKLQGDKSIELDLKQFSVGSEKVTIEEEKGSEEVIKKEGIIMPETYQTEVES